MVLWVRLCASRAGLRVCPSDGLSMIVDVRRAYIMGTDGAKIWCKNSASQGPLLSIS